MAKIYGLFGAMTGKLADTVMSVRNGEQIARKYQPVVYNPSTPAQIAQRAKLKLMSQLSAVLAPAIAMPRQGSVSSRNLFTKKNIRLAGYSNDEATINLGAVQLTSSVVSMHTVYATRGEENIAVGIVGGANLNVDRVVYVAVAKNADQSLDLFATAVATSVGEGFDWGATIPLKNEEVVVYAYGVRDNNEAARALFGNLSALTGETVANLVVTRTLTETDITLTKTVSVNLAAVATHSVAPSDDINRSTKKK